MARFSVRFAHLLQWVAEKAHKPLSQQLQILYTHLHTVLRHNVQVRIIIVIQQNPHKFADSQFHYVNAVLDGHFHFPPISESFLTFMLLHMSVH